MSWVYGGEWEGVQLGHLHAIFADLKAKAALRWVTIGDPPDDGNPIRTPLFKTRLQSLLDGIRYHCNHTPVDFYPVQGLNSDSRVTEAYLGIDGLTLDDYQIHDVRPLLAAKNALDLMQYWYDSSPGLNFLNEFHEDTPARKYAANSFDWYVWRSQFFPTPTADAGNDFLGAEWGFIYRKAQAYTGVLGQRREAVYVDAWDISTGNGLRIDSTQCSAIRYTPSRFSSGAGGPSTLETSWGTIADGVPFDRMDTGVSEVVYPGQICYFSPSIGFNINEFFLFAERWIDQSEL